jgi:hypothetical protein
LFWSSPASPKLFTLADKKQGLDRARSLVRSASRHRPTYNGDYSGRRYSELDRINVSTLESLKIA